MKNSLKIIAACCYTAFYGVGTHWGSEAACACKKSVAVLTELTKPVCLCACVHRNGVHFIVHLLCVFLYFCFGGLFEPGRTRNDLPDEFVFFSHRELLRSDEQIFLFDCLSHVCHPRSISLYLSEKHSGS